MDPPSAKVCIRICFWRSIIFTLQYAFCMRDNTTSPLTYTRRQGCRPTCRIGMSAAAVAPLIRPSASTGGPHVTSPQTPEVNFLGFACKSAVFFQKPQERQKSSIKVQGKTRINLQARGSFLACGPMAECDAQYVQLSSTCKES